MGVAQRGISDGAVREVAWLADCACPHRRGDAVEWIGPPPNATEAREAAAARAGGPSLAIDMAGATLARQRMLRGRAERRALGVDPRHAAAVHHARLAVAAGDELVLMTDGLAAPIDVYGMAADDVVRRSDGEGFAGLVTRLHVIERGDDDGGRFPRFKRSDDATGLWLCVG